MTGLRDRITGELTRDRLRLEVDRATRPFLLYTIFAIVALILGGLVVRNLDVRWPWDETLEFRVAVDDASGVVPGKQDVTVAGVPAGKITGRELVDGRPTLTVSLDHEFVPVFRDARMRLRPRTPLQDMSLNIESRGTPTAGTLEEGAILGAERTHTAVQASEVLNVFDPPTQRHLETLLDTLGSGLSDDGEQLRAAFAELVPFLQSAARLSQETAERRRITRRLVHNSRLLFEELASRDDELRQLVVAAQGTLGELAETREPLGHLVRQLPPTLRQLRTSLTTLRGAFEELDPALVALRDPVDALDPALTSLRTFSSEATPTLAALRPPVRELLPTARILRSLSGDLQPALHILRRTSPRLDRITAAVVPCELALQKFFHNTISVFKFGDAHGAYPRGETASGIDVVGGRDPVLERGPSCTDRQEEEEE